MNKKLIYFTNSYPYGLGEQWKTNELNVLVNYFDDITLVPFSFGGNKLNPKSINKKIKLEQPLFENDALKLSRINFLSIFFHYKTYYFLLEFFSKKVYTKKKWIISWAIASLNIIRLLKHPFVIKLQKEATQKDILYFYWGKGSCEILPFINTKRFDKVIVRMHGYDLFEYRNNNYIPYRKQLLNSITLAAPISIAGKNHLRQLFPTTKADIKVFRCGTLGNNKKTSSSTDTTLRVLSCSSLIPLKRIDLMIKASSLVKFPIKWVHIGGGSLKYELESLIQQNELNDKFFLLGEMDSTLIIDFYTNNIFDVFVNTSSTEGVPISIMEAFSVAIPVLATNVGGTSEIVSNDVGELLPADITPEILADALTRFYYLSIEKKEILKSNAFNKYETMCNANVLATELAEYLNR